MELDLEVASDDLLIGVAFGHFWEISDEDQLQRLAG